MRKSAANHRRRGREKVIAILTWSIESGDECPPEDDVVEHYSGPEDGAYRKVRKLRRGKTISFESVPGLKLEVSAILG